MRVRAAVVLRSDAPSVGVFKQSLEVRTVEIVHIFDVLR